MKTIRKAICRYCAARPGATAIEYALIASLVAMAIAGAVTMFGQDLYHLFYADLGGALKKP